jgi:shikimate dehydrogenase
VVTNRSAAGIARLRDDLGELLAGVEVVGCDWGGAQHHADASAILVNATSLGMEGQPPLPLSATSLRTDAIVYDIVTHPHRTPLLDEAEARGLRVHDGLEMLVGQAREAFRRFYRADPPVDGDAELRALLTA